MLVALVSFCAGAVTALATLGAGVRRAAVAQAAEQFEEKLTDRRWQAIMDAAGYPTRDSDVGRRAAARFQEELARGPARRHARAATLTPAELEAIRPRQRSRLPFGIIIRSRE
jgi:hypothetical protein